VWLADAVRLLHPVQRMAVVRMIDRPVNARRQQRVAGENERQQEQHDRRNARDRQNESMAQQQQRNRDDRVKRECHQSQVVPFIFATIFATSM
jgi:hypothetical protein